MIAPDLFWVTNIALCPQINGAFFTVKIIKLCRFRIFPTRSTNQLINLLKEYTWFTLNENEHESGVVYRWVLEKFNVVFILNVSKDGKKISRQRSLSLSVIELGLEPVYHVETPRPFISPPPSLSCMGMHPVNFS